jgi:hypothetical protein
MRKKPSRLHHCPPYFQLVARRLVSKTSTSRHSRGFHGQLARLVARSLAVGRPAKAAGPAPVSSCLLSLMLIRHLCFSPGVTAVCPRRYMRCAPFLCASEEEEKNPSAIYSSGRRRGVRQGACRTSIVIHIWPCDFSASRDWPPSQLQKAGDPRKLK